MNFKTSHNCFKSSPSNSLPSYSALICSLRLLKMLSSRILDTYIGINSLFSFYIIQLILQISHLSSSNQFLINEKTIIIRAIIIYFSFFLPPLLRRRNKNKPIKKIKNANHLTIMAYSVYTTDSFEKELIKFSNQDKEIIQKIFLQLKDNPYVGDSIRYKFFL